MSKYSILFLILAICKFGNSQFFPDSNATWQVTGSNWDMSVMAQEDKFNFFYNVGGDTVLNGLTYQKIHLTGVLEDNEWKWDNPPNPYLINNSTIDFNLFFGGVREADSCVYFIDTSNLETLVMKFNVKAGDTLISITPEQTHYPVCNGGFYNDTIFVDTVIDEVINGKSFRTVIFDESTSGGSETYIQNIGKSGGLFWNLYPDVSNCFGFGLSSFCWGNESYTSWFNSSSPVVLYNSNCSFVGVENQIFIDVNVFPNPANESLNVEFGNIQNVQYKITCLSGQIVKSGVLDSNSFEINTSTLANGFYLLQLLDASNKVSIRKIEIIH